MYPSSSSSSRVSELDHYIAKLSKLIGKLSLKSEFVSNVKPTVQKYVQIWDSIITWLECMCRHQVIIIASRVAVVKQMDLFAKWLQNQWVSTFLVSFSFNQCHMSRFDILSHIIRLLRRNWSPVLSSNHWIPPWMRESMTYTGDKWKTFLHFRGWLC